MIAKVDPNDGSIVFEKVVVETDVTRFLESARKEKESKERQNKSTETEIDLNE